METRALSRWSRRLGAILTVTALLLPGALVAPGNAAGQVYFGADYCGECHPQQYNDWVLSGHRYKLTPGESARQRPIPLPEGYTWDDISYVIGGFRWKSRYLDRDGFVITSVVTSQGVVDGHNQYNLATNRWVDYHPGEEKPYDCGRCHTTGYSPEGNQDGLPGLVGTWAFGGIQCEACHGPGGHEDPIDRSSELCGQCHIRGAADTIPARGGFIRHHEQYNEQLASPHRNLVCVDCHNPHRRTEFSIVRTCEGCHADVATSYVGSRMEIAGVSCTDCHMPKASKSAEVLGPYQGDVATHLFRINPDLDASMFTEDGNFVQLDANGQGAVTLEFACARCHLGDAPGWVGGKAKRFHQRSALPQRAMQW